MWLAREENFTWLAGEGLLKATFGGEIGFLVLGDALYLIHNDIHDDETLRRIAELTNAQLCGYVPNQPGSFEALLTDLTRQRRIGTDGDQAFFQNNIDQLFAQQRLTLTPSEQGQYRTLCRDCASIVQDVARTVRPGQAEKAIAAELAQRFYAAGIKPSLLLISADSGIRRFRHPAPGDNVVNRFAILIAAGTREGRHTAVTRIVAVDGLPPAFDERYRAAMQLNTACMNHSRPHCRLGDVAQERLAAYHASDPTSDWRVRLRADVLDYLPRPVRSRVWRTQEVKPYQAVAWSTGINGIRIEDTFLVLPERNEILTSTENWPVIEVQHAGHTVFRADILRL
ncbi:MAG: M24 family metallopeptidase [Chloroflexi bacterium]|nr:M24 family metallopeptidase [Chloroflexota bacterium]